MRRSALAVLTVAAAAAASSVAAADRSSRLTLTPIQGEFQPAYVPIPLGGGPLVTVVVEVGGDSVAAAQAAAGKKLDDATKQRIAGDLATRQAPVADHIRAHGGRVLAQFQHALNGVKARVPLAEVAKLAGLPGVVAVRPVSVVKPDVDGPANTVGVPFIGAPQAWSGVDGVHGEKIKVAVIDTGIDFTHANFGGPGTPAAYQAAFAANTAPADPKLFGPGAPKVKGGIDLVGDAYDASAPATLPDGTPNPALTPVPDPNPLDCYLAGHGSHVSGTIAGFGVTAAGATYRGAYDASTIGSQSWNVGPGVAPKADLYAVRVFGCEGSTDVVVDAIDWAVKHDMDVINMSLGSSFGTPDSADAIAAENAARAGVIVVASAGNSGFAPYITGSPATGNRVISVAALDAIASFPGAVLGLSTGATVDAIDANGATLPGGALGLYVLRNADGTVSLGCNDAEYAAVEPQLAGKIVVSVRGLCPRVDRAILAGKHGAAAALMINTSDAFPPFEGAIPGATIPFLGVKSSSRAAVLAASSTTLTAASIANPGFSQFASFSSGGPRMNDSALKPSVTAPGVSVLSTWVGTGDQGERMSGTSMASPHVAGVAALTLQAHRGWSAEEIRAAILGTADATKVLDYEARIGGAGLVQAAPAVKTQVVPLAQPFGPMNLSYGFAELTRDLDRGQIVLVKNNGKEWATFDVTTTPTGGSPHTATAFPSRVRVPPHGVFPVAVRLQVAAGAAGNTDLFRDAAGLVTLTPVSGSNGGIGLAVPYYLVAYSRAELEARATGLNGSSTSATVALANEEGAIPVNADFYAWGASGTPNGKGSIDLRAAGVQAFTSGGRRYLVFAVNTFNRFSSAAVNEYDVLVDTNGDGAPDYAVSAIDYGLVTAGSFSGDVAVVVQNLATGAASIRFFANAPTDGSTLELPVRASDLGLTPAAPRFTYSVQAFDLFTGDSDATSDAGAFNAFASAVATGDYVTVAPAGNASVSVAVDPAEWAQTAPKGLMIVNLDGKAGRDQAVLVPAR
ncbi:S8 family serine peptidase [Anaeromyxobacter diazotrophicus]|uniref:Peptidase S8 n=1 Tax=Anaeromyxobacter diazotrophicus TaxID=2590199 RepID=A0A7I9VQ04_9BACT|nr:S8 family serine peptidase [Anaeromyxobacter diazotrophicus]GEJ58200.1 peptidase S8 [Anaeromyxobacter diazotrophicus]